MREQLPEEQTHQNQLAQPEQERQEGGISVKPPPLSFGVASDPNLPNAAGKKRNIGVPFGLEGFGLESKRKESEEIAPFNFQEFFKQKEEAEEIPLEQATPEITAKQEQGGDGSGEDSNAASGTGGDPPAVPPSNNADSGTDAAGNGPAELSASIDTSSSMGYISSLLSNTPSGFLKGMTESNNVVPNIQKNEKNELEKGLPIIEQPTGLRIKGKKEKNVPETIREAKISDPIVVKEEAATKVKEVHDIPQGSPASVGTPQAIPTDPEKGNDPTFVKNMKSAVAQLPTADPNLKTSTGARPTLQLTGQANPQQNSQNKQQAENDVSLSLNEANSKTQQDFGENNIFPSIATEMLSPKTELLEPPSADLGLQELPQIPTEVLSSFDQEAKVKLDNDAQVEVAKNQAQHAKMTQDSEQERSSKLQELDSETKRAEAQQIATQNNAKSEVQQQREAWQQEHASLQNDFQNQSESERTRIEGEISTKVSQTNKGVEDKLNEAELKSDQAKQSAENKARSEKAKANKSKGGFWSRVGNALSSAFDALKSTVNAIFEGLRKLVKSIIEAAKKAVNAMIDVARKAIVGLIKGFGAFLKKLVSIILVAFPSIAKRFNAWIDEKIQAAENFVNRVAENLKAFANKLLDALGKALDMILAIYQTAFNFMLKALEFIANKFIEALNFIIDQLLAAYEKAKEMIEGLQKVWNNPALIEEYAQAWLQPYIDKIPAEANTQLNKYFGEGGVSLVKHLGGIKKHLTPIIAHLAANWWGEIKKTAWFFIWPFAEDSPLYDDAPKLWNLVPQIISDAWDLNFSKATDGFLEWMQALNMTAGAFAGWLMIGGALVGGIIGAFFGGAGAIPGAALGLEFAAGVDKVLLISMVATEAAIILKAIIDLAITEDDDVDGIAITLQQLEQGNPVESADTKASEQSGDASNSPGLPQYNSTNVETGQDQIEYAYQRIANSGFGLAIMAIFSFLGSLGGKIAKGLTKNLGAYVSKKAPNLTKTVKGVADDYGYKNYGPIKGKAKGNSPDDVDAPRLNISDDAEGLPPAKSDSPDQAATTKPKTSESETPIATKPKSKLNPLDEEARIAYREAVKNGYKGKYASERDFINQYRNGSRFNQSTKRFNQNNPKARTKRFTPEELQDPAKVFKRLMDDNPSFSSYIKVLRELDIVDAAVIRRDLQELMGKTRRTDLDFFRHEIKTKYRQRIVDQMIDEKRLAQKYPGVPFKEASHREMLEITRQLNGADKGSLGEAWVSKTQGAADDVHVRVEKSDTDVGLTENRVLDRVEGTTIHEVKNIKGELSQREILQFEDNMRLAGNNSTNKGVEINGKRIDSVDYSFLDPDGALANIDWMRRRLIDYGGNLQFKVYNKSGQQKIISMENINDLNSLSNWLLK